MRLSDSNKCNNYLLENQHILKWELYPLNMLSN